MPNRSMAIAEKAADMILEDAFSVKLSESQLFSRNETESIESI